MIKRFRRFALRLAFTADFLHSVGERATPANIRFVWDHAGRDFDQALAAAQAAGEIPEGRYS